MSTIDKITELKDKISVLRKQISNLRLKSKQEYLTIKEAEQVSGLYRGLFYREEKKGNLKMHRDGSRCFIKRTDLDCLVSYKRKTK